MKVISVNSIKGGTSKTTLSILFINALTKTGYRCLVIDADASNNSLSAYLTNGEISRKKSVFDLFLGAKAEECNIKVNDNLDLIRGDVRLNEFRSTDSLKRLKRALQGQPYDYCIIDTSPTYDNIIGNVLTSSDILLIPVQQDIFSYQAVKYQFEKLLDLELNDLDIHIIFNQFEKPLTENQASYRNQITNMFLNDEAFNAFINPCHISRSSVFRKYINKQNYQLSDKAETRKAFEEVKGLIKSVLNIKIKDFDFAFPEKFLYQGFDLFSQFYI
ncbi:chromosome partitioning protein ParA [Spirochaetia bacterium]|nr:chromosome partitioning protein ParA [Spirochaetia bacterium]